MRRLPRWLPLVLALALPALVGCSPEHSQFRYAMHLILAGQAAAGARMLRVLAETGHAPSQLRLALLYHLGQGVPRDYRQAAHWYAQAAQQGEVGGHYGLAVSYLRGSIGPPDPHRAFAEFLKLAQRGYAPAAYYVGMGYAEGQGVTRDEREAVAWLERAAMGGHSEAATRLATAYRAGELGLPVDARAAAQWEQKAEPPRF